MNITATIALSNGYTFNLSADQLANIKRSASAGTSGFPIGKVIIGAMQFDFPPVSQWDKLYKRAEVTLIADGSVIGSFFADKVRQNYQDILGRATAYCLDALAFTNQAFELEDESGYCTFSEALNYIVGKLPNVSIQSSPVHLSHRLSLARDYTCREVLEIIASANGGNFYMRTGKLHFDSLGESGNLITPISHTALKLGSAWQCEYISITNGTDTVTYGVQGEDTSSSVLLDLPIHSEDLTDVLDNLRYSIIGMTYIPFEISNAQFQHGVTMDFSAEMGDRINAGYIADGYYPYICNMALDYNIAGVHGSISAPDIHDTMSAFSWDKDRNKVKTNKQLGTVSYGNKYGIKSTGRREIVSVGADTPTQKTELQVYNGEIIFADTTDSENIVQAGKIYVDENKQLKIDGLTLTAEIPLVSADWSSTAPYTQTVELIGIKKTDKPICDVLLDDDDTLAKTQLEAWYNVNKNVADETEGTGIVPSVGNIKFTCFDDKPSVDLNVSVKVVR